MKEETRATVGETKRKERSHKKKKNLLGWKKRKGKIHGR